MLSRVSLSVFMQALHTAPLVRALVLHLAAGAVSALSK